MFEGCYNWRECTVWLVAFVLRVEILFPIYDEYDEEEQAIDFDPAFIVPRK